MYKYEENFIKSIIKERDILYKSNIKNIVNNYWYDQSISYKEKAFDLLSSILQHTYIKDREEREFSKKFTQSDDKSEYCHLSLTIGNINFFLGAKANVIKVEKAKFLIDKLINIGLPKSYGVIIYVKK